MKWLISYYMIVLTPLTKTSAPVSEELKSLIHLTFISTLSASHWYTALPIFIFSFFKI